MKKVIELHDRVVYGVYEMDALPECPLPGVTFIEAHADLPPAVGEIYDPATGDFSAPPPPAPKTTGLDVTDFYDLFTIAEQEKWMWYVARGGLPAGVSATAAQEKKLVLAAKRLDALLNRGVDLSHPLVRLTVEIMRDTGFLDTPDRAASILSGQVP